MISSRYVPAAEFPHGLKGLIFDCDGVIFDSKAANITYYNRIREGLGLPRLTPDEETYVHMSTVTQALMHIIPANMRDSAETAVVLMRQNSSVTPMIALERFLPEFLEEVSQAGIKLGICTNRMDGVDEMLRRFNLHNYFSSIKTASHYPPKPAPDGLMSILDDWRTPSHSVAYIGDSKVDEMASVSAGIPFWAFKNETLDANLHVNSFRDLLHWISPLLVA